MMVVSSGGSNKDNKRSMKMKVYQAINAVQKALAKTGISKDRTNTQGSGYKFRGIDDVYNALSPLMAEHGLCILPRMISRTCEERVSKSGGALFYVTVEAEFDFVSAEDGTTHVVRTFGEAMDSGDKATNKAMSAAYKYAAFQAFAIPTEADNDADASTPPPIAPAAPKLMGVEEVKEIEEAAGLANFDSAKICAAYEVSTLAEIPLARFAKIKKNLSEKIDARNAASSAANTTEKQQ